MAFLIELGSEDFYQLRIGVSSFSPSAVSTLSETATSLMSWSGRNSSVT